MTHVVDRHVVVLAPEERHRRERLAASQDVACRGLALAPGDDPVLDADALAGAGVGKSRDVAGGPDAGRARLEEAVHHDATVELEPRLLGEGQRRTDADAHHDQVRAGPRTVVEHDAIRLDRLDRAPEVEVDAVLLVQRADERPQLRSEHALERAGLAPDDAHLEPARPERCRSLEPDEARAHDDRALHALRRGARDDGAAVRERAEREDVRGIAPRHREPDRIRAGGEEQRAVLAARPVGEAEPAGARVERHRARPEDQLDVALRVELHAVERHPVLGRGAGQVVLGEVRPVHRRRGLRADQGDPPGVALAPQHLGRRVPRCPRAHDDHARGRACGAPWWRGDRLARDEDARSAPLDLPARERRERRRGDRLARPHIELRMVPRAVEAVAVERPLGERPAVVRARRRHREHVVAVSRPHEQHGLAVRVTQ